MKTVTTSVRTWCGFIAGGLLLLAVGSCSSDSETSRDDQEVIEPGTSDTPVLVDPSATGRELVTRWLTTLRNGDSVADLMAPNFQIQRADGSAATRDQYLARQATVSEFEVGDEVLASQAGRTLSVRWSIKVTEEVEGVLYENVEAPRLTVFEWVDGSWLIVGYANFNPVVSASMPPADSAGSEATRVSLGRTDPTAAPDQTLYLEEVTIPVGTRLSRHFHDGVQIGHIRSGVLTYTIESGSTTVTRADGSVEQVTGPATVLLRPGDWLVEDRDLVHYAENSGVEPVVVTLTALLAVGSPLATPVDG